VGAEFLEVVRDRFVDDDPFEVLLRGGVHDAQNAVVGPAGQADVGAEGALALGRDSKNVAVLQILLDEVDLVLGDTVDGQLADGFFQLTHLGRISGLFLK